MPNTGLQAVQSFGKPLPHLQLEHERQGDLLSHVVQ